MPRKHPLISAPTFKKKSSPEFKFERDFSYSCSIPCANPRCTDGFMFLVTVQYVNQGPTYDELECFCCKRTKKLGLHNPNRAKPVEIKKTRKR